MSPAISFIIALFGFLLLVAFGMPIAFAFLVIGFAGTIIIQGVGPGLAMLGSAPWQWASQGVLIVVPLFILMGQFAFHSGISRDLYVASNRWIGRWPGGLAMATTVACAGFAACTGAAPASAAAMGTIAYPEMKRFSYDDELSTGCIGAGGTLGVLIPPSIPLILYGFLAQQSISLLFIAGVLPGILLTIAFVITILVMCKINPSLGARGKSFSWKERFISLSGIWGMLVLIIVVIGGLYAGVFAPSEAGAVGALGAFIIMLVKRRGGNIQLYVDALKSSVQITVMALTILVGAMIFNVFITVSGIPILFTQWITGVGFSPILILIVILIVYIPLGMVLDSIAMILLTIPIVFPIISSLGYDPIWFGVLVVIMYQIALLTPPVGMVCYILQGITKVPLEKVFRGSVPFVATMLVFLAILVLFPEITLLLPHIMGYTG